MSYFHFFSHIHWEYAILLKQRRLPFVYIHLLDQTAGPAPTENQACTLRQGSKKPRIPTCTPDITRKVSP